MSTCVHVFIIRHWDRLANEFIVMPVETGHGILTDSNNITIYRSRPNYAG